MNTTSDLELEDYQKWRSVNGDCFSLFDYLRGSLISGESSPDIIVSFARLVFPKFLEKDDMLFIEELFKQPKLDQFRLQGLNSVEIEYWMNLLDLSEVFVSFPYSFVVELSLKIKRTWEEEITALYPDKRFDVVVIDDEGDTFLTVTTKRS